MQLKEHSADSLERLTDQLNTSVWFPLCPWSPQGHIVMTCIRLYRWPVTAGYLVRKNICFGFVFYISRVALCSVCVLYSSDGFFANRIQFPISTLRQKQKPLDVPSPYRTHRSEANSPNSSCFMWHLKTSSPLTTSSTTFHSRASSSVHWCPRALRAAANR